MTYEAATAPAAAATRATIITRAFGNVVVAAHDPTTLTLTDRDWDAFLQVLTSCLEQGETKVVVFSSPSAPTAEQRARLSSVFERFGSENRWRSAIFTDELLPKMAIRALAMMGFDIQNFKYDQLEDARSYVGIEAAPWQEIIAFARSRGFRV